MYSSWPAKAYLNWKKYEGLLYNEHEVSEINQIIDTHKSTDGSNTGKFSSSNAISKTSKSYTYFGTKWKCNEFGHLTKEYKHIPSNTNQFDNNTQEQTMRNTFRYVYSNSPTPQIKYITAISQNKTPIFNSTNYRRFSIISRSLKSIK